MQIEEVIGQITAIDTECAVKAQERFDNLIKPVGSLAKLESMVTRYAAIIGKYDKNELNYPKKGLLIWGSIEQAAEAEKIMLGKWPVKRAKLIIEKCAHPDFKDQLYEYLRMAQRKSGHMPVDLRHAFDMQANFEMYGTMKEQH